MIQRAGFRARLFFAHPSLLAPYRSTSGYALVPVRKHLAPRLREKSLAAIVKPILLQHTSGLSRKSKEEGGTLGHFGFGPNASTVFLNDAFHDGEPDARAF